MAAITASNISTDQSKFLSSKLITRSMLKLVCAQACDPVKQELGTGTTAYFVRYKRMYVPLATLTEATEPTASSFTVDGTTVTLDQWGDSIEISDIAQLATNHPVLQNVIELLSDNAQRVIDREIQIVWMANTNVIYGDGSVTARSSVTSSMKITDALIHKARVQLADAGAPPFDGPDSNSANDAAQKNGKSIQGGRKYLAIAGPHVIADVMTAGTSLGTFASVSMYANGQALFNAEVGTWLGFRWIESNFIPKLTLFGNTTAAVTTGNAFGTGTPTVAAVNGGGTLTSATTYYFKVTRKDLLRGFEEDISIEHSMASAATGDNESFTFAMPSTAGYVYNVYFGSATGDSNLKLHSSNNAASAVATVTAVPSSTTTAPANLSTSSTPTTLHVVHIVAAGACNWVTLQNLQSFITKAESTIGNILQLKRGLGYKFMSKAMVRDSTRLLRLEVAASAG